VLPLHVEIYSSSLLIYVLIYLFCYSLIKYPVSIDHSYYIESELNALLKSEETDVDVTEKVLQDLNFVLQQGRYQDRRSQ